MKITCLAVDDEPLALEKLKSYIGHFPFLQFEGSFTHPVKALEFIRVKPVQLLFLDIQMMEMTGISLVERMEVRPSVIFTTAHQEYALKAFELSVTDYLLKPYTFERFTQAVNKAREYIGWQISSAEPMRKNPEFIFVKSGYKLVKVMCADILFIEGMRDFQAIYTAAGKILASHSFQELEKLLPPGIVRCHKSFMVSLQKIESIEKDRIRIGGQMIPIGESYKGDFYRLL